MAIVGGGRTGAIQLLKIDGIDVKLHGEILRSKVTLPFTLRFKDFKK